MDVLDIVVFILERVETLLQGTYRMRLASQQGLPSAARSVICLALEGILGFDDICPLEGPVEAVVRRFGLLGRGTLCSIRRKRGSMQQKETGFSSPIQNLAHLSS